MMNNKVILGLALVAIGLVGLFAFSLVAFGRVDVDKAVTIAKNYLPSTGNPDLTVKEIMEFQQNYYIVYTEKSTGINAFEMLIDKQSGAIQPEYGPNMMWNTKYGHGGMMGGYGGGMMGGNMMSSGLYTSSPEVSLDKAKEIAQKYLNSNYPGGQIEDVLQFYGYYTVHVERDGKVFGMFSVNAYSGAVWWHNWHGGYIQTRDLI
jgi:hypothetical protein